MIVVRESLPRRVRGALPVLVLAALLASCGSTGTGTPSASASGPAVPTSATPTATTGSDPASTSPTSTPDEAGTTASTSAASSSSPPSGTLVPIVPDDPGGGPPPVCPTASLSVTLGSGEGTTSGTVYRPLVFTNTASSACRLQGFPGVSHVAGDDGHQVGRAGAWVGPRGDAVTIAPGASAHSILSVTDADVVDREACEPTEVRGFRVYPPRSEGAAYVPSPGVSCAADISTIRVRTILPGRGDLSGAAGVDPPRCTTASLTVTLGAAEGAAGSSYQPLVFTNSGSAVCILQGFPGVAHVAGDDGHEVGPVAAESGDPGSPVELAPGDSAHATVRTADPDAFGPGRCDPTAVRGLRVRPPGESAAAFVPRPGTSCAGDVVTLRVGVVGPGAD